MNRNKALMATFVLGGALGLTANSAASQQTTQPFSGPSQPGAAESAPATEAMQELSKNDMQAVQQALKDKGYNVNVNGTADQSTRAAIRKFQQDEGLPVTGIIDERTAIQLGFQVRSQSPSDTQQPGSTERPGHPGTSDQPGSPGSTGQPSEYR